MLGASRSLLFLVSLSLLAVSNKLDNSFLLCGRKIHKMHPPLDRLFSFVKLNLVLFSSHNKLDPRMACLGEKHAPLFPRILIVFILIFVECSSLFLVVVMFSSCFHAYLSEILFRLLLLELS